METGQSGTWRFPVVRGREAVALQAQRMPASADELSQYVLNQRVDTSAPFLNMMLWEANARNEYDIRDLKGRPCYAGLDLGATKDMTALVLVFADRDGGFDVIPFCWLPGETLSEREDEDNMPYRVWAQDGHLLTFPGRATDPKAVAMKIAELHGMCKIKALAFDRWRIEDIKRELDAIGCRVELIPFGQGFKDLSPRRRRARTSGRAGQAATRRSPRVEDGGSQLQSRNGRGRKPKAQQAQVHRPH